MLTDKKKIGYGQRPDLILPIGVGKHGSGIRLFIVASKLCEHFIKTYSDRARKLEFFFDSVPYLKSKSFCLIVITDDTCHVEPAFIKAERLHPVGIFGIHFPEFFGIILILFVMRINKNQVRTFCLSLPYCFGGLDAVLFCRFILGKDYSVPHFRIAGHGHRIVSQFRPGYHFDRCKITVLVYMKDDSLHGFYDSIYRTYFL